MKDNTFSRQRLFFAEHVRGIVTNVSAQTGDILLVEDNQGDVRLVEEAAKDADRIETIHVADGEEALDFVLQNGRYSDAPHPDIILLDWDLPTTPGEEVLVEIRATERIKRIPVIVLTGSQSPSDVETAYESRANAVVEKPAVIDGFSDLIQTIDDFWLDYVCLPSVTEPTDDRL